MSVFAWASQQAGRYGTWIQTATWLICLIVFTAPAPWSSAAGHVVLPLLQSQVVPSEWVSNDVCLAGYGAAQAAPGPLFTFAAYLGAVSTQAPSSWLGAGTALVAIFLPSFLLIVGTLPFWEHLRRYEAMQRTMLGINAAVVGLLLAAFYNPVWTSAIRSTTDFCLAAIAFLFLVFWKSPPWLVVLLFAVVTGLGVG